MIRALTRAHGRIYHIVNGRRRDGPPPGVSGDLSGVSGNLSGVRGDLSGVSGDLSDVQGDLDACGLTPAERAAGVNVADLTAPTPEG